MTRASHPAAVLPLLLRRIIRIVVTMATLMPLVPPIVASSLRPTPKVELYTADGATVNLADYQGRIVLIDFWASWCPPCKTSFPALDVLYREYRDRGVEVLAVNLDERRHDAETFLSAHPHQLTVLYDPKGVSPQAFGVKGMPSSFIVDRAGTIRFTHMGYSGDVDVRYRQEITQLLSEH
jgi:cytochrome c biogenesis protein CcmG/thiol:disulfide interchange protein DsbE